MDGCMRLDGRARHRIALLPLAGGVFLGIEWSVSSSVRRCGGRLSSGQTEPGSLIGFCEN